MIFFYIFLGAFILGAIILAIAGLNHVPEGKEKIIEKMGEYNRTLKKGWHYINPFMYHIVAKYSLSEVEAIVGYEDYSLKIVYKIIDSKAFHYSGHCYLDSLNEIFKNEKGLSPERLQEIVLSEANNQGVEVVSLDITISSKPQ